MKKLSIATILVAFALLGCSNKAIDSKPETKEVVGSKVESKLNAEYLISHYWLGSSIRTGLKFGAPNTVESEIQAETDCHPSGTFQVVGDQVKVVYDKCASNNEMLTLTLGKDEENLQYTEFLIDQNGHKYYNTSSIYPAGTKIKFVTGNETYAIETIESDPEVLSGIKLYQKPSLDSSYYELSEIDGATKSLFSSAFIRQFIGKYELNGETWYLITPFDVVMGDLRLMSNKGDTVLKKDFYSLPYTWVNSKDLVVK